jgi:hypothetical protein
LSAGPTTVATTRPAAWVSPLWASIAFAAGLAMCFAQGPTQRIFHADNQIYFYVAERVASGVPPHVSLVDHKHALSGMISGCAIRAGRTIGVDDAISVRAVSMAVGAGTVSAVWLLAWRLTASLAAAHLSAAVMLTFVDFFMQATMGVRPQVFMAFFLAVALTAFAGHRPGRAGAGAICSFLCWQPALLVLGSLVPAALFARARWRTVAWMLAGALVALAAYESYFAWHGALREQLVQSYAMRAHMGGYKFPPLHESIHFVTSMGLWRRDYEFVFPSLFLASIPLVWLAVSIRPAQALAAVRQQPAWLALVLLAHAALGFTFIDHQAYPDMFFLEPLIAVACGIVLAGVAERLGSVSHRTVTWALAGCLLVAIGSLAVQRRNYFGGVGGPDLQRQRQLAAEVKKLADERGTLWAFGCLHLLAFNRMENFLPYGMLIDPKLRAYIQSKSPDGLFIPLRNGKLPDVILAARGGERQLMPWLPRIYEVQKRPDFKANGIQVWFLKPPEARSAIPKPRPQK